jgi:hypothetical protein
LLVSASSDMMWSTHKADDYDRTGRAPAEVINAIQRRLPAEAQFRAPCGESLLSNQLGCGLTLVRVGLEVLAVDLNQKVRIWPSMGRWSAEIAQEDNPSYGWLFRYTAGDQLWHALRHCAAAELETLQNLAQAHRVQATDPNSGGLYLVDAFREAAEVMSG